VLISTVDFNYNNQAMSYNISKKTTLNFSEAIGKVSEELKKEGFGIITEIDLKDKFKEKLQVDFRNYKILGACNPKLAYEAIKEENNIGILLPCNILVQEHDNGQVEISAVNPMETMASVKNENLDSLAKEVSGKLQRVIDSM
jgi:uncharacterized protein (DUF302 family)